MKKLISLVGVILCTGLLLFSCTGDKDSREVIPAPEDIISAHTSGVISCESSIRIRFVNDVVDTSEINLPLEDSPLIFEPELEGVVLFSARNTLEFRPAERLPAGQTYHVTMQLSDYVTGRLWQDMFSFEFTVITQSFTVNVEGLQIVDEKVLAVQQLNGRLLTADAEYAQGVEQLLTAEQAGRNLPIRWRHDDNQRIHAFVVDSVFRGDDSSLVFLKWDGDPIGVDLEGSQVIVIPPANTFSVTQFRVVQDKEQYVEIRFSDPLQKDQNLSGLITVEKTRQPRFSIDGNIVRVYNQTHWTGDVSVTIAPGIRNSLGQKLRTGTSESVSFPQIKPAIRFVGQGVIIPGTEGLTVPFEAVNLRAIVVEATPIAEGSMSQFLQVNNLKGGREMRRVGRVVWKETVPLDLVMGRANEWIRYGLDVRPLLENHPAGLYHLTISFKRRHVMYPCPDVEEDWRGNQLWQTSWDRPLENSNWEAMEAATGIGWREMNEHRSDPCHPAYYQGYWARCHTVSRNVLVSDIGLIAKKGANDSVLVVATDIGTTEPLSGVQVTLLDYSQIEVGNAVTDGEGMAVIDADHTPFLLVAKRGDQTGYLRLADGASLSVSHFDVAGESVAKGFKGFLYGERGVWRPGDSLFITFVLMDRTTGRLPPTHPLRFELHDSRGQLVTSITRKQSQNGCYVFRLATTPDAPTGNWKARVKLGGATFEKKLKIETVMPNRLKVKLDFGDEHDFIWGPKLKGSLSAVWLHGAPAKRLKSDIEVTFASTRTRFEGYEEYVFDDQATRFRPESHMLWEGKLDDTGFAALEPSVQIDRTAPGMLRAAFRTRVYEPGGAFSVDYSSALYQPFSRYVGLRIPKGDRRRGMLLTDTSHSIQLAVVDRLGKPVSSATVEVKLYKIQWRWWWEKGNESPADYIGRTGYEPLHIDTVEIKDGAADYEFRVDYPDWGRFLVRARDLKENHQTGKIFYVDWPGWAGRARKDAPGAANVLTFSSEKEEYQVGEQVVLTIPTGKAGRALVTIESGIRVIKADWIEAGEEPSRYEFTATADMAPNVYAHVTFVQPHLQVGNDLPIRMYGVIPIKVTDPQTKLVPMITAPSVLTPSDTAEFSIREANGRAMTYTVAIVDEGLLDLTSFPTPDPWNHFYKREALGVKTWDLFDMVAGAYGGKLEQLLAIGGGEAAGKKGSRKASRFVPMVRFMGPFVLPAGDTRTHRVDIPQYVGSVRMMVVAGHDGAFGAAEKTMPVRKPLMILGTLPRGMVTNETVDLPISVFALEPTVKKVDVSITVSGALRVEGASARSISFSSIGDQLVTFKLKSGYVPGFAEVVMRATGGGETAEQVIELDVKPPGFPVVDVIDHAVRADKTWTTQLSLPGSPGTNSATLEVSRIPPLNLAQRLNYLIRYPHGCVEQTISAVFPQLYLSSLLDLTRKRQDDIQDNIKAAIRKLPRYQTPDGGFGFWRGANTSNDWCSSYAGHFFLEASRIGYALPRGVMDQWKKYQRKASASWVRRETRSELAQAYRLYTLALAGAPELGAMNRLKEELSLPVMATWRLAAAYQMAGQPEVAEQLVRNLDVTVEEYTELSYTYGSTLRDEAMVLETLCLLKQMDRAMPVVQEISRVLCARRYLSTQTTAFALIAMARYAGITKLDDKWEFSFTWNNDAPRLVSESAPLVQIPLSVNNDTTGVVTVINKTDSPLFARLVLEGTPPAGREKAAENGMKVRVQYTTPKGDALDIAKLEQGTDIVAEVTVTHTGSDYRHYRELALTTIMPSGWEIRNLRMESISATTNSNFEFQDIRDDRIHTYFSLGRNKSRTYRFLMNASYLGRFYLPMVNVEAMYDATINARQPGRWVEVVKPGSDW